MPLQSLAKMTIYDLRFLLRDTHWLGYVTGWVPMMNTFQALSAMLYLGAAVECDDLGCRDVGATRTFPAICVY